LFAKAVPLEGALEEIDLLPALEKYPLAEVRDGKGVIFFDVVDAYAFLEWLSGRSEGVYQSFRHRRVEVFNRTLFHEGIEWMCRRLHLFPLFDAAFQEFLSRQKIEAGEFGKKFKAEYGQDFDSGEDGIYHLFAEFCEDYQRRLYRHLPDGILSEAASFVFDAMSREHLLSSFHKRIERRIPEIPAEAYVLEETNERPFASMRMLLEKRGMRVAGLAEIREVDRLIEQLSRSQESGAAREKLTKLVPGIEKLFDVFGMADGQSPIHDRGILAAVRSRVLAHVSPGAAPRRIGVVGYDQNVIAALRKITTEYAENLEVVVFLGQKPRDIMQWIKYNSQLGVFESVRADECGFLYLGCQKSAAAVYHGWLAEPSAALTNVSWQAFGVTCVMLGESQAGRLTADVRDRLRQSGVEVVAARAEADHDVAAHRIIKDDSSIGSMLGAAPSEGIAYALGVSTLSELGRILVVGADIVEKHDDPAVVQPTYRVAGVYQVIHKKNPARFGNLALLVGAIDESAIVLATNEFKTNIPRGKLLRINAVLDSKVSREKIISRFRSKAQELDILELPEWWVQLTSNLNFGNPKLIFDPNQVYVSHNDAGAQVSIAFFVDEAAADVDMALRSIAGFPVQREYMKAADQFAAGMPLPCRCWDSLDVVQQAEFSRRHVSRLAQKYSQKSEAVATKRRARKYSTAQPGSGHITILDSTLANDAMRLLFLESQPVVRQEVLRDETGEAVAIVALHENRHKVYSTPLLTTASLENIHQVMGRYYSQLRRYALDLSREYDWEILIHDVYEHGDKLRATLRVHHLDYNDKKELFERVTFVSVDQYDKSRQRWQTISRPNSIIHPSSPETYNIVINGPGGRMGSCTLRLAAKSEKLRVVALGGPDARRLAELLNEKDYVQGRFPGTVDFGVDWIELDGRRMLVFSHPVFRDPGNYPWKCFLFAGVPIHVAIDATGRFNNVDGVNRHRRAGALRTMITAPGSSKEDEWREATFIRHINDHKYDSATHFFLSPASCTTGCLANLNRLVELAMYRSKHAEMDWEKFFDEAAKMVLEGIGPTYHSLTGEHIGPDIIDPIEYRKDIRRGTDATGNIFETSSGASASTALVDAAGVSHTPVYSIRFPIETVSIMAPTYVLRGHYTMEHIDAAAASLEQACRAGAETRFQFLRTRNIDRSTQIRLLRELAQAGATLCKDSIEIAHFTSPTGEPMTIIQLIGWYENEWRPSKMYVEFLEEIMLPAEKKFLSAGEGAGFAGVSERLTAYRRPYEGKLSVLDLPPRAFDGVYWLIRVDHNVVDPLYDPDTNKVRPFISDDHRIMASAADVEYLIRNNARVIVLSHNGRKKDFQFLQSEDGQVLEPFSLKIAGERFAEILERRKALNAGKDFRMASGLIDAETAKLSRELKPGQVLYLENLRFYDGEESGSRHFAKALFDTLFGHLDSSAQRSVSYVNSAFGASHRGLHASFLPLMNLIGGYKVMGLLPAKELSLLDEILKSPKKPVAAFVSGMKMAEKIPAVEMMIRHGSIQRLFTAAPAFLVASGFPSGNSVSGYDPLDVESQVSAAHRLLELAAEFDVEVKIAADLHIGLAVPDKFRPKKRVPSKTACADEIPFGAYVYDILPEYNHAQTRTGDDIKGILEGAATVILNGTVGLYEVEQFSAGNDWLVRTIADCGAELKLVVGGDGVAAVNRRMGGIQEAEKTFDLCTGGGAALKYLATQSLSAFDGLDNKRE